MKTFMKGIGGGFLIGIGGAVFLACENRIVGAVLFSVALASILGLGMWLLTGKVCYPCSCTELVIGLIGNITGTAFAATVTVLCSPEFIDKARALMSAKLLQPGYETMARAFMCEMCIYIAVEIWKKHGRLTGVFLAVPAFVLAGFEHSIADIYYMFASNMLSEYGLLVLIGNALGGLAIVVFNECMRE